jgi:hypothetical protein
MRDSLAALGRSIVAALRPSSAPWAVGAALWAVGTAALIAGTGVLFGELQFVGLAYLGAGNDSAAAVRELCGRLERLDRAAAAAEAPPTPDQGAAPR